MTGDSADIDRYVLSECFRIASDPTETPERRRKAEAWFRKLAGSTGSNWEGGGQTVAEKAGVEVDPKAPGGQRLYAPDGSGGSGRNALARGISEYHYSGGTEFSPEIPSTFRTQK